MPLATVVLRGRQSAESLMTDTFAAYSPNGTTTDADGYEVQAYASEGTTPGKVQARARQGDTKTRMVTIGGVERPVLEGGLHVPVTAFVVGEDLLIKPGDPGQGWEFECTALGFMSAGQLGARYLVVSINPKTWLTARRLDVVQL